MDSPRTRVGPNANMDVPGDIGKYIAYLDYHRPTWQLLMTSSENEGLNDNAKKAIDKILQWGGHTTLRIYHPHNGDPWNQWTVAQMVERAKRHMQGYPVFYEWANEPRPGQSELESWVAQWNADFIYSMVGEALSVTGPGWASGNYSYDQIAWWKPMMQAFVDVGNFRRPDGKRFAIFSAHGYAHALLNCHCAGENPVVMGNPKLIFQRYADLGAGRFVRPSADQVFKTMWDGNWLTFRSWWVMQWIREFIVHDQNWNGLSILETEDFWDDMPNIRNDPEHRFDAAVAEVDKLAGEKVSGIPTLEKYWDAVGAEVGWPGSQVLAAQLDWAEHIAPSAYEAFLLFSYTENDNWPERWASRFGIQRSTYYIDLYPVYRAQWLNKPIPVPEPLPNPEPTPEPEPEPIPEEPEVPVNEQLEVPVLNPEAWQNGTAWVTSQNGVNVRKWPTTAGNTPLGMIKGDGPGCVIRAIDVGIDNAPDKWALVWFGDLKGWAHTDHFIYERFTIDTGESVPAPAPEPEPYPYINSTHIWDKVIFEPGDVNAGVPELSLDASPELIRLVEDILDRPEYYLWNPLPGKQLMQAIWFLYNAIAEHNGRGADKEGLDTPSNPE